MVLSVACGGPALQGTAQDDSSRAHQLLPEHHRLPTPHGPQVGGDSARQGNVLDDGPNDCLCSRQRIDMHCIPCVAGLRSRRPVRHAQAACSVRYDIFRREITARRVAQRFDSRVSAACFLIQCESGKASSSWACSCTMRSTSSTTTRTACCRRRRCGVLSTSSACTP